MKDSNDTSIIKVKNYIRTFNVIDEKVLDAICSTNREDFVPKYYKSFAFTDIPIPLDHGQSMLLPSVEGLLLQSLKLNVNDNVLVVGSGSGFLAACLSKLVRNVTAIDIFQDFITKSKAVCQTNMINNIEFIQRDIQKHWEMIHSYDSVVLTFSMNDTSPITQNLRINSKAFVFIGEENSPIKFGKIISKTENNGYTREHIIQTNIKHIIKGLKNNDRENA